MIYNSNGSKLQTGHILVTGSSGLIGSALVRTLRNLNIEVKGFDIIAAGDEFGDVRDREALAGALEDCAGVVHLAAISRVIHGEKYPKLCRDVNLNGIRNILSAISEMDPKPWLIFSSSREVYGNAAVLPVDELHRFSPVNVYGDTKVKSELAIEDAIRENNLKAAILRFSNVFGGLDDYSDRVVPAFINAAINNEDLRVDGCDNTFDFTYLNDVVNGIVLTINLLKTSDESPDPLHLVSGKPTTLRELAETIIQLTRSRSGITVAPQRTYDVAKFYGSPGKALKQLGWSHQTSLEEGLLNLIAATKNRIPVSLNSIG